MKYYFEHYIFKYFMEYYDYLKHYFLEIFLCYFEIFSEWYVFINFPWIYIIVILFGDF